MQYKIKTISKKDWQGKRLADVEVIDLTGAVIKGTIWEDQKDGSKYPNFDGLTQGLQIEVTAWTSPTAKVSFFPPKPVKTQSGSSGRGSINQAQEKKAQSIGLAQDRKEEGIMISSSIRMAVDIMISRMPGDNMSVEQIKEEILKWRYWFVSNWSNTSPIKVTGTDMDYPVNDTNIPF